MGQPIARAAYSDAGTGCRKKRRLRGNSADTCFNVTGHESEPTSDGSSSQENLENQRYEEKQMTALAIPATGASSAEISWDTINWQTVETYVHRLQMRIAKAAREGRHGKVKALQWLLTHSFHAKLLAVKRVVQNTGGKTPGIDHVIWKTAKQKMKAALSLKRRGYRTQPLRRIYIPKKDKRLRPLSIPPMKCRAMQALHLLALEPVVEMQADKNAYGFRPRRSTADAIEQCFKILSKKTSAQWILEGDIKSCFDKISHTWLKNHVMMDKGILGKWLTAGYIDKGHFYLTEQGTPQGAICSPTLLNVVLSGLEQVIKASAKTKDKVHVSIYADDFIITGASKEVLEYQVKPVVESFLRERGLELSVEKTKITPINEGFNFLGVNIRKYRGKLIIKPSKESIKHLLNNVREIIKKSRATTTENLIEQLNPRIRGWANYYRHVVSKETFAKVDAYIFKMLWKWAKRRHPKKNTHWLQKKYFRNQGLRRWLFHAKVQTDNGITKPLDLVEASRITIRRHVKIRAEATPYNPAYESYFKERKRQRFALRSWVS